jgi:DNA polymerase I
MAQKLFLLDAMALIYRAYFALAKNPRITSQGVNTNAQYGFTNTLLDILNKEKPSHIAVAFDHYSPTERHIEFAEYKANREAAPEDLIASLPDIKAILEGFNIPILEVPGYEADDIIGTVAHIAAAEGFDVYMVTPDKDYGQLVTDKVFIWKPPAYGNPFEILDAEKICTKWGIKRVDQVIDILGLMGDASDNIPGIPGVGEKTAAKLLEEYDTLENVLANAHLIKGKMGEKIAAGKESAIMSKKLATIIMNVPVAFDATNYQHDAPNVDALTDVFNRLEFRTLGKRILGDAYRDANSTQQAVAPANAMPDLFGLHAAGITSPSSAKTASTPAPDLFSEQVQYATISDVAHEYICIDTQEKIEELITILKSANTICFDTETTNVDANLAEIVGMSFCIEKHKGYYVPLSANKDEQQKTLQQFEVLFNDANITWVGHNIKYDILILKWCGFALKGKLIDTMLAHYLVEPEGRRSMDTLSEQYLQYKPVSITELIGPKGKYQGNMRDVDVAKVTEYAAEDADVTLQLNDYLQAELATKEVASLFENVECPLVNVLADMESEGVKIDVAFLNKYSAELETDIKIAEESVYKQADYRFNLASPKQLGEVLFDKLKLDPKAKKTGKSGQYATGEEVLSKLASKHKIVDDILTFRELSKLKSTYVDSLPLLINPRTNRIHTSYNQAVAVTGRLSSNAPNLQNIPIRTDKGKEIRKAFIPRSEEYVLMSADYSQIELRIIAAMANDANMIAAFKNNIDIHVATAAKVYGVPTEDVTKEQRRNAKAVNFGIIYGQSAFGLAENLGISRTEAKEIIDTYWLQFGSIKTYMDEQINSARELGYVQTILGRKRWLKDINSGNQTVRGFAERNAVNMPIQGSAADMIKMAMLNIQAEMKSRNLKSKMILQVHDELVFDAHKSEVEELKVLVKQLMENALALPNGVPTTAEVGVGDNWLEAH